MASRKTPTGIRERHGRACAAPTGGRCTCRPGPSYEAWAWSARYGKKIRKSFPTISAAKSWRSDAARDLRKGTMTVPTRTTLREAAEGWLEGARAGRIRKRNGQPYKPSLLRSYEGALRARVLPGFGAVRLSDLRRVDLQRWADELRAEGLDASTIRNTIAPVRPIYRLAIRDGEIAVNPTAGLELPAPDGRRDRIASPEEAATLLAGLAERDRPLWATALYAGLRAGELMALRWSDVDLAAGVIRVERGYDPKEREFVAPKSKAGRRTVPIAAVLRDYLVAHKLASGRHGDELVFGATVDRPFTASNLTRRAATAWQRANKARAEAELEPLEPISLHEARHTLRA
jgi:integrase